MGKRLLLMAVLIFLGVSSLWGEEITEGKVVVSDRFIRFGFATGRTLDLGTTPKGGYKWVKRVPTKDGALQKQLIYGSSSRGIYIGYWSGLNICDPGISLANFTIADGVIQLEIGHSVMAERNNAAYINYRAKDNSSATGVRPEGTYQVEIAQNWLGKEDVILFYGHEKLASADVSESSKPTDERLLKVAFKGNHHMVWIDGKKIINFEEAAPGRDKPGYVGFGNWGACGYFNGFKVSEVK